jgi:hypothetical protein
MHQSVTTEVAERHVFQDFLPTALDRHKNQPIGGSVCAEKWAQS